MDEIETISFVIALNFVPAECIADSVSMGDLFPALNQPQIYELESSPCPYRIEAFLLL
ncbi:hypothetical protein [Serratia plymuthica]|uniref:hypothetical protein n=1 Tax=Serratia plymuthica TaxID=82996 RepID=UPI001F401586|nr:hypothetical protein [Serratia plymuthica]